MQELNFINRLISSQDYALGFAMMVFYASVGFVILARGRRVLRSRSFRGLTGGGPLLSSLSYLVTAFLYGLTFGVPAYVTVFGLKALEADQNYPEAIEGAKVGFVVGAVLASWLILIIDRFDDGDD